MALCQRLYASIRSRSLQVAYAKCHIDWAKKNVETWREAKEEVEKIDVG